MKLPGLYGVIHFLDLGLDILGLGHLFKGGDPETIKETLRIKIPGLLMGWISVADERQFGGLQAQLTKRERANLELFMKPLDDHCRNQFKMVVIGIPASETTILVATHKKDQKGKPAYDSAGQPVMETKPEKKQKNMAVEFLKQTAAMAAANPTAPKDRYIALGLMSEHPWYHKIWQVLNFLWNQRAKVEAAWLAMDTKWSGVKVAMDADLARRKSRPLWQRILWP